MRELTVLGLHSASVTATESGTEVDLAPYAHVGHREVKAFLAAIPTGAETDETCDYKLQESDTTVDGDFADISGATFTQVTQESTGVFEEIHAVIKKRYTRGYYTGAGTTPMFALAAALVLLKRSTT